MSLLHIFTLGASRACVWLCRSWIPYLKAPNQCELNCQPRGERFYYRHKRKVIDGTSCGPEELDVCVDGQCMVGVGDAIHHTGWPYTILTGHKPYRMVTTGAP